MPSELKRKIDFVLKNILANSETYLKDQKSTFRTAISDARYAVDYGHVVSEEDVKSIIFCFHKYYDPETATIRQQQLVDWFEDKAGRTKQVLGSLGT